MNYPVTPDGRYFVVRERLWRASNPALEPARREARSGVGLVVEQLAE